LLKPTCSVRLVEGDLLCEPLLEGPVQGLLASARFYVRRELMQRRTERLVDEHRGLEGI
jgi:hypothetical protein